MTHRRGWIALPIFLAVIIKTLSAPVLAQPTASVPVVKTDLGPVEGAHRNGVETFLGFPFAAPPTGERRLAPPVAPAAWTSPLRATIAPSACPQTVSPDPAGFASNNEDCLYLNIWAPTPAAQPRPVMVWVHGGGFVEGYGAAKQYDATRLAARGECRCRDRELSCRRTWLSCG